MMSVYMLTPLLFFVFSTVHYAEGGECCLSHFYIFSDRQDNDAMWCSDYCCDLDYTYGCCNDISRRAGISDRISFCPAFFAANVWAAVLLALGILAAIAGMGVCCYKCCCNKRDVTVVNSTNQANNMTVPIFSQPTNTAHPVTNMMMPVNPQPLISTNPVINMPAN